MTANTPAPLDKDAPQPAQHEDACAAAPQAGIGMTVDDGAAEKAAPLPPHGDSLRREISGSEDPDDAGQMVYDDRTDDRPAP